MNNIENTRKYPKLFHDRLINRKMVIIERFESFRLAKNAANSLQRFKRNKLTL